MKNKMTNSVLAVFLAAVFMLTSCMSLTHTVGDGAKGGVMNKLKNSGMFCGGSCPLMK